MNVPKGKPSVSPPVQIAQAPTRNIGLPSRGQTPPTRTDYTGILDPQATYSIQQGFAVPASHSHEMNKQAVTSGHLPQPGLPQQQGNLYSPGIRQQFYPSTQQQGMRPSRSYISTPPQANQAQMYPTLMYVGSSSYPNQSGLMYQPQGQVMYSSGQRMTTPPYSIPTNVQQTFQPYQASQQYAPSAQQPMYSFFPPQQQQQQPVQQTQAMPVTQSRPASVPNQTQPAKRERNPITIVDPTTQKDVTDEILHHKSTPPSSSGTPVSFPVSSSPPQQQNEICAQFASQVAATLRPQSAKQSSTTPGAHVSEMFTPDGEMHSQDIPNEQPHQTFKPRDHKPQPEFQSEVISGETSVDPPSIYSAPYEANPKDTIQFEPNEYNVNVSLMQNTAPKAAVVSANITQAPEQELLISKVEPISVSAPSVAVVPKTDSATAEFKPESKKLIELTQMKEFKPASIAQSQKPLVSVNSKPTVLPPVAVPALGVNYQKPVEVTQRASPIVPPPVQQDMTKKTSSVQVNVSSPATILKKESEVAPTSKKESEVAPTSKKESEVAPTSKKESEVAPTSKKESEVAPTLKKENAVAPFLKQGGEVATTLKKDSDVATINKDSEVAATLKKDIEVTSTIKKDSLVAASLMKDEVTTVMNENEVTAILEKETVIEKKSKPDIHSKVEIIQEKSEIKSSSTNIKQNNTENFVLESTKVPDPKISEETEEPVKQSIAKDVPTVQTVIPAPVIVQTVVPAPVKDNKDEKFPKVEIKIENVDVSKENAKNNEMTTEALISEPKKTEMQLQYKYKADQWSPLNPEGKMIYDRDFLLQLQFSNNSVSKPQGLPNLPDIILDKPMMQSKLNDLGNSVRDFTPEFFHTLPGRSGSSQMMKKRNSQQVPRNEPVKKIIKSVSISLDIKLHKAENAWEPGRKVEKPVEDDTDDTKEGKTADIYKKVKSILNKLTPQKFQTLLKQMHELEIDTESRLKGVTDLIFEKAVSEPAFSVAYANMCRYLMQLKVPSDSKPGEKVNFRVILLTKCQREFEKDKDIEIDLEARQKKIDEADSVDEKKRLEADMVITATLARRRSIGNIRFIGELFKLKMLTENIMHDCVFKLLRSRDEENLECLCRLLTTIGKELDIEKAKPRVDQYFQKMLKIVGEKKTSSRVRFMLQDVIDLRLCNWVPRREDNNPKTIDQIHKEHAKESAQRAYLSSQNPPPKHGGRDSRDGRSRGGPPNRNLQNNQRTDDGWNTVASKPIRSIDLSKMKITKTTVDDNIQLGPGGGSSRFGVWGRGSSGGGHGTKSSSQEGEAPTANTPANRFTALHTEEEGRPFGRGLSPARSDSRNRGMGGFGRGRLTPRSSQEKERERAIASVRNITGRTTPSSSNPASRENSRTREPRVEKSDKPTVKILSEDDMEKKTKTIVNEYLHINDIKEACMCVSEINHPSTVHLFVEFSINHVLERSSIARQQTGHLHHELISNKIITVDSYLKGLNQTLEMAEDMEIDIPKIWQYLGQLIGPLIQDGSIPLSFLKQVCESLQGSGKSGRVVAEVLHDASQRLGHKKVAALWKNSGLQWSDFVSADDVKVFLADNDLEFTVAADSQPSTPVDKVSFETIQEQLLVRLRDTNCDNEHIFDWIEANIPDETTKSPRFIRTLMTAVCKSAINEGPNHKVAEHVIKQRQSLLVKYLHDNQSEFEIQALYALQSLVNELQHPPGVLRTFFDTLYDEDIISEDGFNQWSNSDDLAEQEGKGVAMKAVVQFFAWLKEGDQDES